MRKIQAHPITHESWMLQEWGNRVGVLTCDQGQWHLISKPHTMLNQTLDQIQQLLDAELVFEQPECDDASDHQVEHIDHMPIKHANPHNIVWEPCISYTRTSKSLVRYAAGYWIIKFDTGWSGALCPKLTTLDSYAHEGPFSDRLEMITILNKLRKES